MTQTLESLRKLGVIPREQPMYRPFKAHAQGSDGRASVVSAQQQKREYPSPDDGLREENKRLKVQSP